MLFDLKIEKVVPPGNGLGYFEGKTVFVEGTSVGDIVKAYKVKEKKRYIIAAVKEIVTPSPNRVEAPCPHYHICGGCSLMHLTMDDQIALKKEMLEEVLTSFNVKTSVRIKPSSNTFHYRYRSRLNVKNGLIGFQKRFSNDVIAMSECLVLSKGLNQSLNVLRTHSFPDGALFLHESCASGDISAVRANRKYFENIPGFKFEIEEDYGAGAITLQGGQFAQANPGITAGILSDLAEHIDIEDEICELYCGSGTFSMGLAPQCKSLIGLELSEIAVQQARQTARTHGLKNTRFEMANLDKAEFNKDVNLIVADPPRAGLSSGVMQQIAGSKASRFLYISCNPATMARDCEKLSVEGGFNIKQVVGYDMYPHTTHLEVLAVLER